MKINIPFEEYFIFEGDLPMIQEISCKNSVDQSTSLEIGIVWKRNNCESYFPEEETLKLIHTDNKMDMKKIKNFLLTAFESSGNTINGFIQYYKIKPSEKVIKEWLEKDVKELR